LILYLTSTISAKYQPYDALRQRFWRQYLKQYDTDDTYTMSHLELTSMLDPLGSTLTRSTVSSFFTRFDKAHHDDIITIDQPIQCLEAELGRPESEKKSLDVDDGLPDSSVSATPVLSITGDKGQELQLDHLDFSGPSIADYIHDDAGSKSNKYPTEPMQRPLHAVAAGATPENSDSWSDEAEGDLSSSAVPSPPSGPSSPGTSVEQNKVGQLDVPIRRKARIPAMRLLKTLLILSGLNASSTSRTALYVIVRDSTPKLRSTSLPI
jgi:phosphatidylserine decarboxylase